MFIHNSSLSINILNIVFFWAMSPFPFLHFIAMPEVHAQDKCETALAKAQSMYEVGRSLEVIGLLTMCLPEGIPVEQRAKAYELLALAYIAEEVLDEGKHTIIKLLDADKNYRPDASIHPAKFVELTQEAIDRRTAKKRLRKYLLYGGGGLTAAMAVTFLVFKGEEPSKPLPEPPDLPRDP